MWENSLQSILVSWHATPKMRSAVMSIRLLLLGEGLVLLRVFIFKVFRNFSGIFLKSPLVQPWVSRNSQLPADTEYFLTNIKDSLQKNPIARDQHQGGGDPDWYLFFSSINQIGYETRLDQTLKTKFENMARTKSITHFISLYFLHFKTANKLISINFRSS